jgi:hypothetical protein
MSSLPKECMKLRERLPELAEGVLGGRQRARLERHVASCARCASELAALRVVVSSLRSLSPEPMPARILDSVRQEVARAAPPRVQPVRDWVRLAVASAAGGVVLAIALAFCFTKTGPQGALAPARGQQSIPTQSLATARVPLEMAQIETPAAAPRGIPPTAKSCPSAQPKRAEQLARGSGPRHSPAHGAVGKAREAEAPPVLPATMSDEVPSGEGAAGARGPHPYQPRLGHRGAKPRGDAAKRAPPGDAAHSEEAVSFSRPATAGAEAQSAGLGGLSLGAVPAAPVRAGLALAEDIHLLSIVLSPAAESLDDVQLAMDKGDGHPVVLWKGRLREATSVPLPASSLGGGRAAFPVTIQTKQGLRRYVLFLPVLARIGETAPSVPAAHYQGELLGAAFARLSELSGLVLLVEGPLDRPVIGELPAGDPDTALARLAAQAGFAVESQGDVLRTLTRAQGN